MMEHYAQDYTPKAEAPLLDDFDIVRVQAGEQVKADRYGLSRRLWLWSDGLDGLQARLVILYPRHRNRSVQAVNWSDHSQAVESVADT